MSATISLTVDTSASALDAPFGDEGEEGEPLMVGLSEIDTPNRWDHFAAAAMTGMVAGALAAGEPPNRSMVDVVRAIADDMLAASDLRRGEHQESGILLLQRDALVRDLGLLLGQIDAARAMDDTLFDDPEDIAIIENIRAHWSDYIGKTRTEETAR